MDYKYADIPEIVLKKAIPLERHLWKLYQKLGWDYLQKIISDIFPKIQDIFLERFIHSIKMAKHFIDGKISNSDANRILTYQMFPAFTTIRCDLQQGTMKLLYGNSCDVTFIALDDFNLEIKFLINGHFEEGFPIDLWIIESDSELLEERHKRYGYKLKNLYTKTKNLKKTGFLLRNLLKKIRDNRTPQFSQSQSILAMLWGSVTINLGFERSSFEIMANIWDYLTAKRNYHLPDDFLSYVPCPPLLNSIMYSNRPGFTLHLSNLITASKLYLQGLEKSLIEFGKNELPEAWIYGILRYFKEGIPLPKHTLTSRMPNLKEKNTYEQELFDVVYERPDCFLHVADIGMTEEEALEGVYLNITHETPYFEKVDKSKIISTRIGLNSQFQKSY
ncbi:MAG: hypothetical protein ACTSYB_19080 [Candidatus Helarchaeota archaeon]